MDQMIDSLDPSAYHQYEYLASIIKDKPIDYESKKSDILKYAQGIHNDPRKRLINEQAIIAIFNELIKLSNWRRRHIYLLCYDLIDNHDTIYPDFDILPTELAKDLAAFHSSTIKPLIFKDEPEEALLQYINSYAWLRD